MQFHNNFDLEEFLAYLLPGFLFLGILILEHKPWFATVFQVLPAGTSDFFTVFLLVVLFITISVILGHVFSLASRYVWRVLTNLLFGDPEKAIFATSDAYFTTALNQLLANRFARVFGAAMNDDGIRPAVPRLIRSYVFTRSQSASVARERIVRSRSICSNLITPILIIAALGPLNIPLSARIALAVVALLLLIKQRDLDVRESKEIYLTFAALTDAPPTSNTASNLPKA
jgi:hypothetical protein